MKKYIFILVFAAMALVSCENEPRGNFNHDTFNRQRQLWLEQDIQHYSFRLVAGTESGPIGTIMYIQDGVLAYIQVEGNDDVPVPVEERKYLPLYFGETISDVYAEIERLVSFAGRRDTIEIQYDSEWHYPTRFRLGWDKGDFRMMNIHKFVVGSEIPLK